MGAPMKRRGRDLTNPWRRETLPHAMAKLTLQVQEVDDAVTGTLTWRTIEDAMATLNANEKLADAIVNWLNARGSSGIPGWCRNDNGNRYRWF